MRERTTYRTRKAETLSGLADGFPVPVAKDAPAGDRMTLDALVAVVESYLDPAPAGDSAPLSYTEFVTAR